ncbi:MAG: phosphatase PAP2 family protein [Thermoprotei archaeon]
MNKHIWPATLAAVAYVLFSLVLVSVGENFSANRALFEWINSNQLTVLNPVMVDATKYGREYFWIPVVALLWIFGKEKGRRSAFIIACAFIVAIVIGLLSKTVFAQPRPFEILSDVKVLVSRPSDYSYPSGHAVIVSTGAIAALLTLPKKISLPLVFEAVLVSYSRVYVGVHWPADVVGGWLLGLFCAEAILWFSPRLEPLFQFAERVWNMVLRKG